MPFARWVTEKLPRVGDRIYHREFYVTGLHDHAIKERSYGWGEVERRHGDPGGMLCEVRFDISTATKRDPRDTRIVWNYDCHFSPDARYGPERAKEDEV